MGDVVVAVNGRAVESPPRLTAITARLRGDVGSTCRVRLRSRGKRPRDLIITRVSGADLYPPVAARAFVVGSDLALLATGGGHAMAVRFDAPDGGASAWPYRWSFSDDGVDLNSEKAKRGSGLVGWGQGGATVQIAEWRLDLRPWPEAARGGLSRLYVHASNMPIAVVPGDPRRGSTIEAKWPALDANSLQFVRPRPPPRHLEERWPNGPCRLPLRVRVAGEPWRESRVTLALRSEAGVTLPGASVQTDARGDATVSLPADQWQITGVVASAAGAGRDLAFAGELATGEPLIWDCRAGVLPARDHIAVELTANTAATATVTAAADDGPGERHKLIGTELPDIDIQRWLGDEPKRRNDRGLLIYLWATWCEPCRRIEPILSEIQARLGPRGLTSVWVSVDRDELQVEDHVAARLPGAPVTAWAAPDLLATLGLEGVPTVLLVDATGRIRDVFVGTEADLTTWTARASAVIKPVARRGAATPRAAEPLRPARR